MTVKVLKPTVKPQSELSEFSTRNCQRAGLERLHSFRLTPFGLQHSSSADAAPRLTSFEMQQPITNNATVKTSPTYYVNYGNRGLRSLSEKPKLLQPGSVLSRAFSSAGTSKTPRYAGVGRKAGLLTSFFETVAWVSKKLPWMEAAFASTAYKVGVTLWGYLSEGAMSVARTVRRWVNSVGSVPSAPAAEQSASVASSASQSAPSEATSSASQSEQEAAEFHDDLMFDPEIFANPFVDSFVRIMRPYQPNRGLGLDEWLVERANRALEYFSGPEFTGMFGSFNLSHDAAAIWTEVYQRLCGWYMYVLNGFTVEAIRLNDPAYGVLMLKLLGIVFIVAVTLAGFRLRGWASPVFITLLSSIILEDLGLDRLALQSAIEIYESMRGSIPQLASVMAEPLPPVAVVEQPLPPAAEVVGPQEQPVGPQEQPVGPQEQPVGPEQPATPRSWGAAIWAVAVHPTTTTVLTLLAAGAAIYFAGPAGAAVAAAL